MGRKAKFDGTQVPTGRGKKVKKQSDPTFPQEVLGGMRKRNAIYISKFLLTLCKKKKCKIM